MNGLIDAGDWQTRALDAQGYCIDDTKGLAVEFVKNYLNSKAMQDKFAVGKYFDTNPDTLNWWVWNSGMNGRSCTIDFGIRFMLPVLPWACRTCCAGKPPSNRVLARWGSSLALTALGVRGTPYSRAMRTCGTGRSIHDIVSRRVPLDYLQRFAR
jgi:hypothetical protein